MGNASKRPTQHRVPMGNATKKSIVEKMYEVRPPVDRQYAANKLVQHRDPARYSYVERDTFNNGVTRIDPDAWKPIETNRVEDRLQIESGYLIPTENRIKRFPTENRIKRLPVGNGYAPNKLLEHRDSVVNSVKKPKDKILEKAVIQSHEQINISDNGIGYSYQKVFANFFEDQVLDLVQINDPYIKTHHQLNNLLRFCEMMIKSSRKIKKIVLLTTKNDSPTNNQQVSRFEELEKTLSKRSISFVVAYSAKLHDREIKLSNGWIIKIGRGLDYFKRPESNGEFSIGLHDYDLRPCHQTTIDIFHKSSTKITN